MSPSHLFELIPLWLTFVGMVAIVLLSIYGGFSFTRWRRTGMPRQKETPASTIVRDNRFAGVHSGIHLRTDGIALRCPAGVFAQ